MGVHVLLDAKGVVIGTSAAEPFEDVPTGGSQIEVAADTAPHPGQIADGKGGFSDPALSAAMVARYAETKHGRVLNGGISVDVGGGEIANVSTTDKGRGLVDGCLSLASLAKQLDQPEPTFPWVNNDGATLTLSVAQVSTIALAVGLFVQETYRVLGQATSGLAGGTIKTTAAIDALPWPANG